MGRRIAMVLGMVLLAAGTLSAQDIPAGYAFDRTSHDFGVLKPNQRATTVFHITNNSTEPLVLLDVTVSCNCATVHWPRQPILPGHSAELTVVYKDKSPGAFYKVIDVSTNSTPRRTQLRLKGTIEK